MGEKTSWEGRGVELDWDHTGGGTEPIIVDEGDIPAWERPPAPAANTPMERFHRLRPQETDRPSRETPDERRARSVTDIINTLDAGSLALAESLAWCRSINYHPEVTELIDSAAELVSKAQGLIEAFEEDGERRQR